MTKLQVRFWDGTGQLLQPDRKIATTIRNSEQKNTVSFKDANPIEFTVPFDRERPDRNNYAVLASMSKCCDVGFVPVQAKENETVFVDLMLRPRDAEFNFAFATWDNIRGRTALHEFLTGEDDDAEKKFNDLKETSRPLAALLNITTAISKVPLEGEEGLLAFFKQIELRPGAGTADGIFPDRIFAWADPRLEEVLAHNAKGTQPMFEKAPSVLHRNARISYKEMRFGEANLQFTFLRDQSPAGRNWVKLDVDMDYFHDEGAHLLLEVLPNTFVNNVLRKIAGALPAHLTDPAAVFALRWMAGRHLGEQENFNPLFTLQPTSV